MPEDRSAPRPVPGDRLKLRATFDTVAEAYDVYRPDYPPEAVDAVFAFGHLRPGDRALEVGCGPGKATLPFARRGLRFTCVELGEKLIERARRHLAGLEVRFVHGSFERFEPEAGAYTLGLAASSFHWLDPQDAYGRFARALRPGGTLALMWNTWEDDAAGADFAAEAQALYRLHAPELARERRAVPRPGGMPLEERLSQIRESGFFGEAELRRFPFERVYAAADYVRLLDTYSGHNVLPAEQKAALYAALRELIEREFSGQVRRRFVTLLYLARRDAGG
ncbi:SAM-dependent methyltransferase [Deinobacterium chartae]|uniref:SAM-dependent methyltransferase n=1 Tax=Deinobacterium chartae TaxID=521158 RepID=A0A841I1W6_9DEIO|nr:class I SAM-dependent methyltransferase [Deinobacterium chartae]MBB6099056.1 SAM-dependent methyltransferase [Deinobacterium chartae]